MIFYNIALADGLMCGAAITHYAVRNLFPPKWDSSSNWKISVPLSKCKHQILRNHDMMWVSGVSFSVNITMVIKNPAKYKDVLQTGTTYNKVIYMYVIIKHNFGTFYNKVVYMYFIVKHNSYEARNTTTGQWPCRCPSTGQDGSIELEMVQELYYSVHNNLGSRCDLEGQWPCHCTSTDPRWFHKIWDGANRPTGRGATTTAKSWQTETICSPTYFPSARRGTKTYII